MAILKHFLRNNISTFLFSYFIILFLLNVLPINGKDSALNNNYVLQIRLDYLGHFIAYGLLGVLGFLYAKAQRMNVWLAIAILISFAVAVEFVQKLIFWRTFNINDLVANTFGTGLGIVGIYTVILLNKNLKPQTNNRPR